MRFQLILSVSKTKGHTMNLLSNHGLNTTKVGLYLCAASIFFASGCSTIVNRGRHSASSTQDGSPLERRVDPWVWGNAAFAVFPPVAVVGLGIDAFSGNWYRYDSPVASPQPTPSPAQQPSAQQQRQGQMTNPNANPDLLDSILK